MVLPGKNFKRLQSRCYPITPLDEQVIYSSAILANIEASLLTDVLLKIADADIAPPPRNRTVLRRTLFGALLLESISTISEIIVL
jgi:hypothetical protein